MAYTCSALPVALKVGVDAELLVAVLVAIVSEITTRQALIVITTTRAMRPAVELVLFWVSWDTPTPQSLSSGLPPNLWKTWRELDSAVRTGRNNVVRTGSLRNCQVVNRLGTGIPADVRFVQDGSRFPGHHYLYEGRPMTQGERPT
ncbi:MAG TPA: hypothetical protein VHV57_05630 [Acidimicrobiales bacterium]|nr:hypothetical protein [Acidimicrobiales bacterium]